MEILILILTVLITLVSIPLGRFLSKIAKEELKESKEYLIRLQDLIISLILIFFLQIFSVNKFIILIIILPFFVLLINFSKKIKSRKSILLVLIVLQILSSKDNNSFFLISSLNFIYGIFIKPIKLA